MPPPPPPLTGMALNHLNLLRPLLVRQIRSSLVAASRVRAPVSYPDATSCAAACTRLYATKKAKGQRGGTGVLSAQPSSPLSPHCVLSLYLLQAKAKGQVKVNVNSSLVEDIISLDEVKADMSAVLSALKDDFTRNLSIRTSPGTQPFFSVLSGCRPVVSSRLVSSVCSLYTQHKRRSGGSGSPVDVWVSSAA